MEVAHAGSLRAEGTSTVIVNDSKKINSLLLRIASLAVIAVSCRLQHGITGNTRSELLQAHAQIIVTAIGSPPLLSPCMFSPCPPVLWLKPGCIMSILFWIISVCSEKTFPSRSLNCSFEGVLMWFTAESLRKTDQFRTTTYNVTQCGSPGQKQIKR